MDCNFSDDEIIEGILAGGRREQRMMACLYKKNWDRLLNYARGKDLDIDDVKDLVQKTFVIFNKNVKIGRFKRESAIGSYMTGILKNQILGFFRDDKRFREKFEEMKGQLERENWRGTEKESAAKRKKCLDWAKSQLKEEELKIIDLRFVDGWSMKEIAEELGYKNDRTVITKFYRIKTKLRDLIEECESDSGP